MTFLQTLVAIIALRRNSTGSVSSMNTTNEQRNESYRLVRKALLLFLYLLIPCCFVASLGIGNVKLGTPLSQMPPVIMIPFGLQSVWTHFVLLVAFFRSNKSIALALLYGIAASILITILGLCDFARVSPSAPLIIGYYVLWINVRNITLLVAIVFFILAWRTFNEISG